MRKNNVSAGRAITDYFNSNAWPALQESDLLAALMKEMMRDGKPVTSRSMISRILAQLEDEADEAMLKSYRMTLEKIAGSTGKNNAP